jgi:hypothetical protein
MVAGLASGKIALIPAGLVVNYLCYSRIPNKNDRGFV